MNEPPSNSRSPGPRPPDDPGDGPASDDPGSPERTGEPPRDFLTALSGWLRGLAGGRDADPSLQKSLNELIDAHGQPGTASLEDGRIMIHNLLGFGALEAEDVMVPRPDIVAVPDTIELEAVIATMIERGLSRVPVYHSNLDTIRGFIHVRDLLPYWSARSEFRIDDVLRDVLFVPPSMPLHDLLRQMRAAKMHMALVVDEHGGIDGLVTIEDVLEEIVGEIEDEHDRAPEQLLNPRSDGSLDADARVPVPELEDRLGLDLLPDDREDDIDTVGGLVTDLAGRVPAPGDVILHPSGVRFEIVDADPRRLRTLVVRPPRSVSPAVDPDN